MSVKRGLSESRLSQKMIEAITGSMRTISPAEVISYDRTTHIASVQPKVREVKGETLPLVEGVRVLFPRGGGFSASWDLVAGDRVALLWTHKDITLWLQSGADSDPLDLRTHGQHGQAFALAGISIDKDPIDTIANTYLIKGPNVTIESDNIKLGSDSATDAVANGVVNDANWALIKSTLVGDYPALSSLSASTSLAKVKGE